MTWMIFWSLCKDASAEKRTYEKGAAIQEEILMSTSHFQFEFVDNASSSDQLYLFSAPIQCQNERIQ